MSKPAYAIRILPEQDRVSVRVHAANWSEVERLNDWIANQQNDIGRRLLSAVPARAWENPYTLFALCDLSERLEA